MPDDLKTTTAQREAQRAYNDRQRERGYFQTRPWLPEELKTWHEVFVRRAREWRDLGVPMDLPPLPPETQKNPNA